MYNSLLNPTRMYELYITWCGENEKQMCKKHMYIQKLKEMNISFHRPRKDLCERCKQYHDADNEEKSNLQAEYDAHMINKNETRDYKAKAINESRSDKSNIVVLDFDLQAVLHCPKTEGKPLFYKRKLSSYNLTIFDCTVRQGHCNFWPEYEADGVPLILQHAFINTL